MRAAGLVKMIYPDPEARFWKDLQRAPKSRAWIEDAARRLK